MTGVFFNDIDPKNCRWVENAFPEFTISDSDVRSINANDVAGFRRCHFFGGIGGWELGLRLAGWPEELPVWTGSCPCPPFSSAGNRTRCVDCGGRVVPHPKQTGIFACVECDSERTFDGRHLWPEFLRLIEICRPTVVFGEQVAGFDGLVWLAGIRATLEEIGYGVGAADLCAAGVGSPQLRQRIFWVAYSDGFVVQQKPSAGKQSVFSLDPEANFWGDFTGIRCSDGKQRRIQSGIQPFGYGIPARVGRFRGYGNAIVPQVAAKFVRAFLDTELFAGE